MDREVMKDKIKKLLALSADNPSDEESYSALKKAQALMAQYKIEEGELSDEKRECVTCKTSFSYGSNSSDAYLSELASIIADNFCCVNYISRLHGTRTYHIVFMGLDEDVDVCVEAMDIANSTIIRGYNRVWKDMCKKYNVNHVPAKYFNPAKVGYIEGYLRGLKEVFDSQKAENQEWGLVLVAPQEAKDFLNELNKVCTANAKSLRYTDMYYNEGYEDGKRFNMNKKISESDNKKLEVSNE